MEPLKVGILGVSGHFIKRVWLPLQQSEKVKVHAIASRSVAKARSAAESYNIPVHYGSYEELLQDDSIDFVYIPLPNHMHKEWVMKAADAGKHILCEKPFALNAGEAIHAIQYAESNGVKVMEAFMYRFHPQWIHVKNLIQAGEIGNVLYINSFFSYHNPDPQNIRNVKSYGGGALMDIGCYAISIPRFLLQEEPQRVFGSINLDPNFQTDSHTSAILDFGKARAVFSVSTLTHPWQKVEIHGTAGNIVVEIPLNVYSDVPAEVHINTKIGFRTVRFDLADQYKLIFDAFAESIINNKPVPLQPSDAVLNMKVIDAIIRSSEKGGWEKF